MTANDRQNQPKSILDQPVSVFLGAKSTDVAETVPLGEVLHRMQDGTYRASIAHVRQQHQRGKAAYKKAKEPSPPLPRAVRSVPAIKTCPGVRS